MLNCFWELRSEPAKISSSTSRKKLFLATLRFAIKFKPCAKFVYRPFRGRYSAGVEGNCLCSGVAETPPGRKLLDRFSLHNRGKRREKARENRPRADTLNPFAPGCCAAGERSSISRLCGSLGLTAQSAANGRFQSFSIVMIDKTVISMALGCETPAIPQTSLTGFVSISAF